MKNKITHDVVALRRANLKRWINNEFNGSQSRFVEKTGINQGELSGLLRDKSFGEKKAMSLEEKAGMPPRWLDADHEEAYDTESNNIERKTNDSVISYERPISIKKFDDIGGSMGRGILLQDQPGQITNFEVTDEWLNKNVPSNTGKNNLCIVTGFGDSMKGMFNPGDPLIVDTGIKKCSHDGLYFFRVGEEGYIKRLQRIPNVGIKVISKNPDYETWTITGDMDFEILAKVLIVWESTQF
jgi:phage repressor protein C with HTH and peptisase S24 domain